MFLSQMVVVITLEVVEDATFTCLKMTTRSVKTAKEEDRQ